MSGASWSERLFGGLKRTSEKLGENLAGLTGKARLDEDDLDRIEEALITADLGPAMAGRIRERLGATWGIGETGAAGPTGNRYGDAAGHTCIAVSGPIQRAITLETASADRRANMDAFAKRALELILETIG